MRRERSAARLLVPALALLAGVLASTLAPLPCRAPAEAQDGPTADAAAAAEGSRSLRGYAVTGGAAAGYVDDRACTGCHTDLAEAYREVGMANSFFRPSAERVIEDFTAGPYHHERSHRVYEMALEDGRYLFRRYQLDDGGERANLFETEVDWVLGSGNHSRTYLFQTEAGELYQLPLAWYTQAGAWRMAPGYDSPEHEGLGRRVRRECMFCHNAYPDVPVASDIYRAPQTFPHELPEGTGCQRCHGPGAEHVRLGFAADGAIDFRALADSILNPADLSPQLRNDICYGCHMQPSVAIPGVRRFGRGDYSFRPGEPLSDYLVQVDVDEAGEERSERFEINHHPYRLEQSRCFQESAGALSCLTCHDPHRKVPAEKRAAHYRTACLGCHTLDACQLAAMAADPEGDSRVDPRIEAQDCASCHMPRRRTQDVIHAVMTDHFIRREPGTPELLAPREESTPQLVGVELIDPRSPEGALAEVYRAAAVLQTGALGEAPDHLARMLVEAQPRELDPYSILARTEIKRQRYGDAEKVLEWILRQSPDNPLARQWLAVAYAGQGRPEEAITVLREELETRPESPELQFNLGRILVGTGRPAEALEPLERALELRPHLALAWLYRGRALAALEKPAEAEAAFRQGLVYDPAYAELYVELAASLEGQGREAEALRLLHHGARVSRLQDVVRQALEKKQQPPGAAAAEGAGTAEGR